MCLFLKHTWPATLCSFLLYHIVTQYFYTFRNVHHYMSSHHLSPDEDTPWLLTIFPELYTSYKWLICFASGSLCLLISFICLFTPLTLSPLVSMCLFSVSMSLFWKKKFFISGKRIKWRKQVLQEERYKVFWISVAISLLFLIRKFFTHGLLLSGLEWTHIPWGSIELHS